MKQNVLNVFQHLTDHLVRELDGVSTRAHHADAAQAQGDLYSSAIALRARELHAQADALTDTLALVRLLQTNEVSDLDAAALAINDDTVRAKLEVVRDALLQVRAWHQVVPVDARTHAAGEMQATRPVVQPALDALADLGVPLPAEVPEAPLTTAAATSPVVQKPMTVDPAALRSTPPDHANGFIPEPEEPTGVLAEEGTVQVDPEELLHVRGLLRRARSFIDQLSADLVHPKDATLRAHANELSASLQAGADAVNAYFPAEVEA